MDETLRIFVSIATAIVLEAMPFLALGALLSAVVEVYVSAERLTGLVPRSLFGRITAGVVGGVVLPTCECGVVPVARRLLRKNVPASTVVAYLLSAPIVNPVVLASTYVAFRGSVSMVVARAVVAALVAGTVAWLLRASSGADLVREEKPGHAHDHDGPRWLEVWRHAGQDFLEMGAWLVLGALAAAALKTLLPPSVLLAAEGHLALSIAGMMGLAITLSVCSEADAFVAASFVTLPAASHLAFLTIGPMVDLKLIAMYVMTFRRRLVLYLVLVPCVLVFALCWLYGVLG